MAKFYGDVGYIHTEETAPGVFSEKVTRVKYYGDVLRDIRRLEGSEKVNSDVAVNNSVSILADKYANGNIFAIRFVEWMGALWTVSAVEVQSPRLILTLGGVYNGPEE